MPDDRYSVTVRGLVDALGHFLEFVKSPAVLIVIAVLVFGLNLEEILSALERIIPALSR